MTPEKLHHPDTTFPHDWQAEILEAPPLIAPTRHYIYPQAVEEVERGALQIYWRSRPDAETAMATFALGFADPSLPHGVWSCPNPRQVCALAGGYAYVVDIDQPEKWMQIPYRPVTWGSMWHQNRSCCCLPAFTGCGHYAWREKPGKRVVYRGKVCECPEPMASVCMDSGGIRKPTRRFRLQWTLPRVNTLAVPVDPLSEPSPT